MNTGVNTLSTGYGYPRLGLLIGDRWVRNGRQTLPVHNPATGDILGHLPIADPQDINDAAEAAATAFNSWRNTSPYARSDILKSIARRLHADSTRLAYALTLEQGKPLAEAELEIQATADAFEWMAEECIRVHGRTVPARDATVEQMIVPEPIGPVAAFTPWNFPAALAARKIAPALAAGCTMVLKPAEETPGTLVMLAETCEQAGLPPGVLNLVFGRPAEISKQLIEHPTIRKVSFTGSVPVGKSLAELAGRHLKKITLELGGHAPVILCEDIDVETVARQCAQRKFRNAGQYCHCPTRFLVHSSCYRKFLDSFSALASGLHIGNGIEKGVQMGPLIDERRITAMREFCEDARARGSEIHIGGHPHAPDQPGHFWTPTVIASPTPEVRAMREEPFGPIALMVPYEHIEDAIKLANGVPYGLAAYAFTESRASIQMLRTRLDAGTIAFNTFQVAGADVPFGGVKDSGIGYEMGTEGLHEYLRLKTIIQH